MSRDANDAASRSDSPSGSGVFNLVALTIMYGAAVFITVAYSPAAGYHRVDHGSAAHGQLNTDNTPRGAAGR
jgi:hypothetical protein